MRFCSPSWISIVIKPITPKLLPLRPRPLINPPLNIYRLWRLGRNSLYLRRQDIAYENIELFQSGGFVGELASVLLRCDHDFSIDKAFIVRVREGSKDGPLLIAIEGS